MTPSPVFEIRPFHGKDAEPLLALWDRALPLDGITRDLLERRILLDLSFEPQSLMVAEAGDALVGFITMFVLHKPIEKVGLREDSGFITAMGVDPDRRGEGIGSALLASAETFFRERGRKIINIAPYTPNYFVPGVDKDNYADGVAFLQSHGFEEYSEGLGADANIATFTLDAKVLAKEKQLAGEGIEIRHYRRDDLPEFLQFLRDLMPGPWVEDARRNLIDLTHGRFHEDAIWLALDEGRIIGFCQHEADHFGPFGVSDDYQGRGVGSVLLARTMYQMRLRGYHCAWVLWTGERALQGVYGRLGFKLTRRFAIMKKTL